MEPNAVSFEFDVIQKKMHPLIMDASLFRILVAVKVEVGPLTDINISNLSRLSIADLQIR